MSKRIKMEDLNLNVSTGTIFTKVLLQESIRTVEDRCLLAPLRALNKLG